MGLKTFHIAIISHHVGRGGLGTARIVIYINRYFM